MKKITLKSIMTLLLIAATFTISAQHRGAKKSIKQVQQELGFELSETNKHFFQETGLVRCASFEHNEKLRSKNKLSKNDEFESFMQKAIAKEKQDILSGKAAPIYTIPVVVHIYHKGEAIGTGTNLSVAAIESQITVLNQDFRKMTGTPGHNNNPVGADTEIQFCLAKIDPNGNATTGITRQQGIAGSYTTATFDAVKPNTQWDPTKYLNIWVADLGTSLLGYAQFPQANGVISGMTGGYVGGASNTDGVVMGPNFFGSSAITTVPGSAPYDRGRTTTHEVGHWLGLKHITGDSNCGDDNCADTPTQASQSNQQTACNPTNSCGSQDMIQNYMDYTNDSCMNIFTQDQTARMRAILNPSNNIVNRGSLVEAGTTHTRCSTNPDYTITATNSPVTVCPPNNAVFNFTFAVQNGYNANTTFSVSNGLPTNATATFNPTSMNTNGNFTLTIGNIANVAAGNYTLTIAADGTVDKTVDVVLNVSAATPSAPTLTTPTNGATNQSTTVNLNWNTVTGATEYIVQRATNAAFTANLASNTVNTNSYDATGLNGNTQYFWRVKAKNACGESANSSAFNFTTATNTCVTHDSTQNNVNIPNATTNGTEAAPGVSTLNITQEVQITDVNVTINITYPYLTDLRVELEGPDGTKVNLANHLTDNNGPGNGSNYTNTAFDDAAANALTTGTAPFTATFKPDSPLSAFNGKTSNGNWKLNVYDNWTADSGTINSWKLEICGTPVLSNESYNIVSESFNLYPNPSDGDVTISFNNPNKEKVMVTLYDMRGRLINTRNFENTNTTFNENIQFSNLEQAIYILKVKTGSTEITKRLLIK